jgi:hypothetical protein
MKSIFEKVSDLAKQAGYLALQYSFISVARLAKFGKIRVQNWKKCSARKELDKANAVLGAEIYSLYKQEQTDWPGSSLVRQYLKAVEDAESRLFRFDEEVERIKENFQKKRQEIVERYTIKRAQAGKDESEE